MKKEFIKFSLATLLALLLVPQVQAASVSVTMNQTNEDALLPDGIDYLRVTISDGAAGAVDFLVETLAPVASLAGSNFGIQSFALNFGTSGAAASNFVLPAGWSALAGAPFGGFGTFDTILQGGVPTRQDPLQFSVTGVDGDSPLDYVAALSVGNAPQGNTLFAANVAGFELTYLEGDIEQVLRNAKFGGPTSVVPLPAAVWLFLSAIGLLGSFTRRTAAGRSGIDASNRSTISQP